MSAVTAQSRCCNAPLRVDSSGEETSCYICEACGEPSGPAPAITRDERHLRAVAEKKPREVYAYVTEAAKRLFDREGKHLVIDVDESGDRLDFRLLDLERDLGISQESA